MQLAEAALTARAARMDMMAQAVQMVGADPTDLTAALLAMERMELTADAVATEAMVETVATEEAADVAESFTWRLHLIKMN